MKEIAAGQFKNQCLALMDEVQQTGEPLVVTKRGKPVVKLVPIIRDDDNFFDSMKGRVTVTGDIINTVPLEDWETR
ncbi:MAG: type II toxin-antitoxin system Phd/YefM family antitoxin [Candidatus Korobacteraceae bacterium]